MCKKQAIYIIVDLYIEFRFNYENHLSKSNLYCFVLDSLTVKFYAVYNGMKRFEQMEGMYVINNNT